MTNAIAITKICLTYTVDKFLIATISMEEIVSYII